jgi:glycerol-3-phosphate acyltransferase PlsY
MIEVALIVAAYFAGSLPFGYWLVRVFRHVDIRTLGSKNTGATNVWRNFGWRFGVGTLLLDVVKGALPALAALHWSGPLTASIAGIAAMLGHGYPVLLGFGGGKGVATGAGAALALFPAGVGLAALAWAIVFFSLRYASLASLAAGATFLVAAIALGRPWPVIAFAALAFGFVT